MATNLILHERVPISIALAFHLQAARTTAGVKPYLWLDARDLTLSRALRHSPFHKHLQFKHVLRVASWQEACSC